MKAKKYLFSPFFVTYLFSRIKTDGPSFYTTLPFPFFYFFYIFLFFFLVWEIEGKTKEGLF